MTKTVSLSDDAYEALAAAKRPGESFSDVALRLARGKPSLLRFAGTLRMSDEDADELKERIRSWRRDSGRPPVSTK